MFQYCHNILTQTFQMEIEFLTEWHTPSEFTIVCEKKYSKRLKWYLLITRLVRTSPQSGKAHRSAVLHLIQLKNHRKEQLWPGLLTSSCPSHPAGMSLASEQRGCLVLGVGACSSGLMCINALTCIQMVPPAISKAHSPSAAWAFLPPEGQGCLQKCLMSLGFPAMPSVLVFILSICQIPWFWRGGAYR